MAFVSNKNVLIKPANTSLGICWFICSTRATQFDSSKNDSVAESSDFSLSFRDAAGFAVESCFLEEVVAFDTIAHWRRCSIVGATPKTKGFYNKRLFSKF